QLAQLQQPAADLQPLENAARRGDVEMLSGKSGRSSDLANQRQPVEIVDCQIVVAKGSLGAQHIGGMRHRIEVEADLDRGFVEDAVMDVLENPAPAAGAEGGGPQFAEPRHRHLLQRTGELATDMTRRARIGRSGDQLGGYAGKGAVKDEPGPAAEIERKLLDPNLGAFRGIDG